MIMTFDFIFQAQHNEILMKQLREAVWSDSDREICTDIHRIHFDVHRRVVVVRPYSKTSAFSHKVVPREITYDAFIKMLDMDWEHYASGDIIE